MFDPILTPILIATAVGGAGYSAYQASESRKDVKKEAKRTKREAQALSQKEERSKEQVVMRARKRRGAAREPGLRDTILTGPSGVAGGTAPAGKTLLGQ